MTEKRYSSAEVQATIYCKNIYEMRTETDKGLA